MNQKYEVNTICDKCKTQMLPVEMPKEDKDLIKLMTEVYDYSKPYLLTKSGFCKVIRKGYIRFKCPNDKFEKMVKLQEILIQGFINAKICQKCDLDVCLWVNCKLGGYIKE